MKGQSFLKIWIVLPLVLILLSGFFLVLQPKEKPSWDVQLNEMNYLIMRTSSINIIYGLNLSQEQAMALKELASEIEKIGYPDHETNGETYAEFISIRKAYLELIELLMGQKTISQDFQNQVFLKREAEATIIKKTVLGAENHKGKGCAYCHAAPEHFPQKDISNINTKTISPEMRKKIDLAHVNALYGKEGVEYLWRVKYDIDTLLTSGQKHMLSTFRCCLIPPNNLNDPGNIGQVFVTKEWIGFLAETRSLSDKDWKNYGHLYFYPIEDLINAIHPGIQSEQKEKMLSEFTKVIDETRTMDEINFELNKEIQCLKLKDALNVDQLTGENSRKLEERQFMAAMFLLVPGSTDCYDKIIASQNQ